MKVGEVTDGGYKQSAGGDSRAEKMSAAKERQQKVDEQMKGLDEEPAEVDEKIGQVDEQPLQNGNSLTVHNYIRKKEGNFVRCRSIEFTILERSSVLKIKPLIPSIRLRQLEALLWRLPPHHPKKDLILEEYLTCQSGYAGEKTLKYYLRPFLYQKDLHFFHNLRLSQFGYFFEIDLLIISKGQIIFIENKNTKGKHTFKSNQFLREEEKINGKSAPDVFKEPLLQVKSQQRDFMSWLGSKNLQIPPLRKIHFVTLTHKQAYINPDSSVAEIANKIFRVECLPFILQKNLECSGPSPLSDHQIKRLIKLIMSNHESLKLNLKTYNILPTQLLKGIRCLKCSAIPMVREKLTWICRKCSFRSTNPIAASLEDYALLVRENITCNQIQDFLLMSSPQSAYRCIRKLELEKKNALKNRMYSLKKFIVK
ncbi:nuclease-related domain-containing protein [Alteribacter keqinensis]|uniref:NERD domain-containing protein n=1 Tax=Alteribacter keqinensis TaxID=2483800 RepID=A0A3M7TT60_9BACI|nr:nuclease-related domain-containing protein [Alteribacter keqinensis]RNA68818.1 NERD domain-containing protein [Alteribacter keqinensis]